MFSSELCRCGVILGVWLGGIDLSHAQGDRSGSLGASLVPDPTERRRIEQAIPAQAAASPAKPRRLLIFNLNVGYGGHPSIRHASLAFALMGEKTGAFETVISQDPAMFKPENLNRFDAVFLNNTVGNLFTEPGLRRSLVEFIYRGGGLLGVHGTTVAFTQWPGAREDWPEFGFMLGARGANHKDSDEHVFIKLDDRDNPINRAFHGQGFDYRDEFFRAHDPYSRNRVRVLFSIDTDKTDVQAGQPRGDCYRADNDYALAWVRNYGRGRIFYCTIAHNPYVFWDPQMLQFYLAALQFALGDLPVPTTPSEKLNDATRAQERLGWRPGLDATAFPQNTFFETVNTAAKLGLSYIGASSSQPVSGDIVGKFTPQLTGDDLQAIRLKLDSAGVRLLTYHVDPLPASEPDIRSLFAFSRKMGIEAIIAEPPADAWDKIERCVKEYDVRFAVCGRTAKPGSPYRTPQDILKLCRGRDARIGAWGDVESWRQAKVDPVKAVRQLNDRLICLRAPAQSNGILDRPGISRSNADSTKRLFTEITRLGLKPTMFILESP